MPRGWASPSTSLGIKAWLLENEEGHAWRIAEDLIPEFERKGYQPPTHSSIAQIIFSCNELGLIELVRTEPSQRMEEEPSKESRKRKQRKIYRIVEEKIDSPEWRDPVTANYRPEEFKEKLPTKPSKEKIEEHMRKMRERLREE